MFRLGFVTANLHSEEASRRAAEKGHTKQGFFGYAPRAFFRFLFIYGIGKIRNYAKHCKVANRNVEKRHFYSPGLTSIPFFVAFEIFFH